MRRRLAKAALLPLRGAAGAWATTAGGAVAAGGGAACASSSSGRALLSPRLRAGGRGPPSHKTKQ